MMKAKHIRSRQQTPHGKKKKKRKRQGGRERREGEKRAIPQRRQTASAADLDGIPALLALSSAAGTGEGRGGRTGERRREEERTGEEKKNQGASGILGGKYWRL